MSKFLFLFLCFVPVNLLFAQVDILDTKNGFKSLQFGTSIEEFFIPSSQLSQDQELILFNTQDDDLKKVFDTKMDKLFLSFEENSLQGIILVKNYTSFQGFDDAINDIKRIQSQFTKVLGAHKSAINNETGTGPVWEGKEVLLLLVFQAEDIEMQDDGRPLFSGNIKVMFLKKDENSPSLRDGF